MSTRKYIFLMLSLFFCFTALQAQGWIRSASDEKALSTPDGNLMVISSGIVKASPEAEIIWRSLLRDSSAYASDSTFQRLYDAFYLPDGTILAAGVLSYRPSLTDSTFSSVFYRSEAYWAKFAGDGTLLWEYNLPEEIVGNSGFNSIEPTADNGAMIYGYQERYFTTLGDTEQKMLLMRIDEAGQVLWQEDFAQSDELQEIGSDMLRLDDGSYALLGWRRTPLLSGERTVCLTNIDESGNVNWEQVYNGWDYASFATSSVPAFERSSDGSYLIVDDSDTGFGRMIKVNALGELQWEKVIDEYASSKVWDVALAQDGGFLVTGEALKDVNAIQTQVLFQKYSDQGALVWSRLHGDSGNDRGRHIIDHPTSGYIIAGRDGAFEQLTGLPRSIGITTWYRTDTLGLIYSNEIAGNIFEDFDLDCTYFGEEGFPQWIVSRTGNNEVEYTVSDNAGYYNFPSDSGDYTISIPNKAPYWDGCFDPVDTVLTAQDTVILDLPQQANVECPYLEVDISAAFLRRCFESTYTVTYCNRGTLAAEDAYVEVELDPYLSYVSSTVPLESNVENLLTFQVGDVPLNTCADFQLAVFVDCDSTVLGQTHCVTAHIYPDSLCLDTPLWSGASLDVSASCQGDSVLFVVTNVGTAPTTAGVQYLVIEDQVILREGDDPNLPPGSSVMFTELTAGATLRLEVEQEPNHPGSDRPAISIEGCTTGEGGSLGYVTQYWENDGDPFVSIDCQENIGSFDPNDKRAYPKGYGDEHFIDANEDIEYHVRFQNTGSDTAFTVVVRDLITNELDLGSLTPGAASHPYTWEIVDERVVQFTFNDIDLVDSLTNESLSHGFIKFRIKQQPDLTNGTRIENTAAIFFDFNEPVITNTTFHTIGEDFITSVFVPIEEEDSLPLRIYPNPFSESTRIVLPESADFEQLELKIYDTLGRELRNEQHTGNTIDFSRKTLPSGIYLYQLSADGRRVGGGKLMIQAL